MSKLLDSIYQKIYESDECEDCIEDTRPNTESDIAKELYDKGVKGESSTVEEYYDLKEMLTDPEDIAIIEEIISDEKNHIELFNKLIQKYDHIEPAKDGLESEGSETVDSTETEASEVQ